MIYDTKLGYSTLYLMMVDGYFAIVNVFETLGPLCRYNMYTKSKSFGVGPLCRYNMYTKFNSFRRPSLQYLQKK